MAGRCLTTGRPTDDRPGPNVAGPSEIRAYAPLWQKLPAVLGSAPSSRQSAKRKGIAAIAAAPFANALGLALDKIAADASLLAGTRRDLLTGIDEPRNTVRMESRISVTHSSDAQDYRRRTVELVRRPDRSAAKPLPSRNPGKVAGAKGHLR